jgi:hypothetical protein
MGQKEDEMYKMIICTAALALAFGTTAAHATELDPQGDFLATYTGPQNGDLDVLSLSATYTASGVTLTSTMNGSVGTTAGSVFLWGVDRGSGTQRLIDSGPPAVGPSGILLDAVVRFESGGGGRVVTFPAVGLPITTILDPSIVSISGNTISGTIPFDLLPSTGFAPQDYRYIFWTRSALGSQSLIADLAPDEHSFAASAVPEPRTWAMMLMGFGTIGYSVRRRRRALVQVA